MEQPPSVTLESLHEQMEAGKQEILDSVKVSIAELQKEILKGLFSYLQAQAVRLQHLEADVANGAAAMRKRMELLEQRLADIERKLMAKQPLV
jgi:hypothetical protein